MLRQIEKMTLWLSKHCDVKEKELKDELKKIAEENNFTFNIISLGGPIQLHVFRREHDFLFFDGESKIRIFTDFLKTEQTGKEHLLVKMT